MLNDDDVELSSKVVDSTIDVVVVVVSGGGDKVVDVIT